MKTKLSLLALAIGTFSLGIAEFSMMGILSDVSHELDVSISKAGHLISAYSLGVAIGAPLLIVMRKLPLKKVLLILASVIVLGNAMASLSSNYVMLLISRFVSGLPHGAFFGCGSIVCTKLAEKGHGAAAVAVMIGGMTVANVVGVPLATFVANAVTWRLSFGLVALFGLLTIIAIKGWVPFIPALPSSGIKGQFVFLKRLAPWLIYGGVFFGQMSVYCWLSYVSPIMIRVIGFPGSYMTGIMMLVGLGMVCGNFVAGKLADKFYPGAVSATICGILVFVMAGIYFSVDYKILSLGLAFLASAGLFGLGGPPQYLIVRFAKGGEMLGGAGIQIAFNVSNACSAVLGSAVIASGYGFASTALVGIPFALIGGICFLTLHHKYQSEGA